MKSLTFYLKIMRKILLSVCAAAMTLSANAQVLGSSVMKMHNSPALQKFVMSQDIKAASFDNSMVKTTAKKALRAEAQDGIYGLYIMQQTDLDGNADGCDSIYINKADIKDEEGNAYNVQFKLPSEGYDSKTGKSYDTSLKFYGKYDAETNKITCPVQVALNHPTYKNIYAFAWNDELNGLVTDQPFTFTVEDGVISLDAKALGFYMADYAETAGSDEGTFWQNWIGAELRPANGVMAFQIALRDNQGNVVGKQDCTAAVAIDDFTYSANVYGFAPYGAIIGASANGFGLSATINITMNADGTVEIPAGQNVWAVKSLISNPKEEAGDYIFTNGATSDGYPDPNTSCQGTMTGNTLSFDYIALYSNLFEVNDGTQTYTGGYGMWLYNTTISLNKGGFAAGIEDVNAANDNVLKNAKCYNVLGQRVSDNAKGLIIRGGKKFVK